MQVTTFSATIKRAYMYKYSSGFPSYFLKLDFQSLDVCQPCYRLQSLGVDGNQPPAAKFRSTAIEYMQLWLKPNVSNEIFSSNCSFKRNISDNQNHLVISLYPAVSFLLFQPIFLELKSRKWKLGQHTLKYTKQLKNRYIL